jgi:hypothetical protein
VAREVAQDSHCFNLYLLVLSSQDVQLDAVENIYTDIVVQDFSLRHIVKQNIGYARDGIENELFVFVNGPVVNRMHKT